MNSFQRFYHTDLDILFKFLLPPKTSHIEINDQNYDLEVRYQYIFLRNTFSNLDDVQDFLIRLKGHLGVDGRIVCTYFNFLWRPFLDLASFLGLRRRYERESNWISLDDIENLFYLADYEVVQRGSRFLCPFPIPILATLINRFIAPLPIVNRLCLTHYVVVRPMPNRRTDYSVSLIIPCKNEAGNVRGLLSRLPFLGKAMEVIFVEGDSQDKTAKIIKDEIRSYKGPLKPRLFQKPGFNRGDAVRFGSSVAKNDALMILDGDVTIDPMNLVKLYGALAEGKGEFVYPTRFIYPMENKAMRFLNFLGNRVFAVIFTYLIGQRITDTLCGNKAILKSNYRQILSTRKYFGDFDPFGDFELLFGSSKLNLKMVEVPVRYLARRYGRPQVKRFRDGFLLLRMTIFAAQKLKFV